MTFVLINTFKYMHLKQSILCVLFMLGTLVQASQPDMMQGYLWQTQLLFPHCPTHISLLPFSERVRLVLASELRIELTVSNPRPKQRKKECEFSMCSLPPW